MTQMSRRQMIKMLRSGIDPLEVCCIKYESLLDYVQHSIFFKVWVLDPHTFSMFEPLIDGRNCAMCYTMTSKALPCHNCELYPKNICGPRMSDWAQVRDVARLIRTAPTYKLRVAYSKTFVSNVQVMLKNLRTMMKCK